MSLSYKTPSYFSSFSCLGSDCEDTCCRNWEVKLDRQHYDLLNDTMSKQHNEESLFKQYVHLNENSISSDHDYAFIRMGVNGYCAMLDAKGLCSIHNKYGVDSMGDVCTMFPRVISRCNDTMELSGALSCPEVVRECIDDTNPLKIARFKPADLPRSKNYPIQREILKDDSEYFEYFELVRETMMQTMANEKYDFETRLYVVANLVNKISPFYHSACQKTETEQLASVLFSLTQDEFVAKLDLVVKDLPSDISITMIVVHSILSTKLQQAENDNISQLYKAIIDKLNIMDDNVVAELSKLVENPSTELSKENRVYIEKALTRYMINCLYREWFVSMPDPFTYFQMLLVRITILRSLIYLDVITRNNIEQHELKQRIVYIMYNFARDIDQNLEFLKVIYSALSEQSMMNFDFSPVFIRLN